MDNRDLDLRQVREGGVSEEDLEPRRQVVIDQLISEGLESGEPIEITDEYWAERGEVLLRGFRNDHQR